MLKKIKPLVEENIVKLVIILLLLVLIYYQVKLTSFVYSNYEDLKLDSFSYGARKFNIQEATCYIDDKRTLYFNQSMSKFILKK